jgi:hypothetical protein
VPRHLPVALLQAGSIVAVPRFALPLLAVPRLAGPVLLRLAVLLVVLRQAVLLVTGATHRVAPLPVLPAQAALVLRVQAAVPAQAALVLRVQAAVPAQAAAPLQVALPAVAGVLHQPALPADVVENNLPTNTS